MIRALSYYCKVGFKGWICIGDSSVVQHSDRIKRVVYALEDKINIIYKHFPKPFHDLQQCFKELIEIAPTQYLVYSGDDDLLIPSALARCAAFLEENPDYCAAHGLRVNYNLKKTGEHGEIENTNYSLGHIWNSEKASERWSGYIRHAASTQYYVHRKETWRRMYRDVNFVPTPYLGSEFLPCSLTAILGKVEELECMMTLFQIQDEKPFSWDKTSMYDLFIHPEWSGSIQEMRTSIVEALMQQDKLNEKQALVIFDREFWNHIRSFFSWQYQKKYGDFTPGEIPISFDFADSCENVYALMTNPNWSDTVQITRDNGIKELVQNTAIGEDKARKAFDRGLWFYLLVYLNKQFHETYEDYYSENHLVKNQGTSRGEDFSLTRLLNPKSPFHKDFMPAYEIITGKSAKSMPKSDKIITKKIETLDNKENHSVPIKNKHRFLQIHSFYEQYLIDLYKKNPALLNASYSDQISALLNDAFSGAHLFAPYMRNHDYEDLLVIGNCIPSQSQWAKENSINSTIANQTQLIEIARMQVEVFKPHILYLSHPVGWLDSRFVESLSWKPTLVIGWRGAPSPPGTDWAKFDVILSHLTACKKYALEVGAKNVEHFYPGFPRFIADEVHEMPKKYDIVFSGQWSSLHKQRNEFIKQIAEAPFVQDGRYSVGFFIAAPPGELPECVKKYNHGPRWGIDMHRVLKSGRVVINSGRQISDVETPVI